MAAQWHPTNKCLILGSTEAGQLVLWDTREKQTPVSRTSLSNGHTYPVFGLCAIPSVNSLYNIVSVSTDGTLCVWNDQDLVEPTSTVLLKRPGDDKNSEGACARWRWRRRW